MRHIINALVENRPGVLARIVGIISGRGYNIDTLNVGPSQDADVSRLTMTVFGDRHVLEQVSKQLNKMVDVIKVNDLTGKAHLERELIMVEVGAPKNKRGEVLQIAALFQAAVVGVRENTLTLQFCGPQDAVEDFLRLLKPYTVQDISRSGTVALARGEN